MGHHRVIAFIDGHGTVIRVHLRQERPGRVTCTTAINSNELNAFVSHAREEGLEATCEVVHQVKGLKFALLDFLVHGLAETVNLLAHDTHHVLLGKQGAELVHVGLVVEDFAFDLLARDGAELSSAGGVSHAN